jgi:cysteine-rich repeat protein
VCALLAGCAFAFAASARGQPVPAGPELSLASSSAAGAILPDVAADPRGGWVVAWQWLGPSFGQRNGIAARSFDATGMPTGPTIAVHDAVGPEDVGGPAVAVGPDGAAMVAWPQARSIYRDIVVRRLAPLGVARPASDLGFDHDVLGSIAPALGGGFLVAWSTDDSERRDVTARWLGADGGAFNAPFRVNETASGLQDTPAIAGRPDGYVAVVWREWTGSTSLPRARVYGPDGSLVTGEIALPLDADGTIQTPTIAVAATPDGFVAAYPEQRESGSFITDHAVVAQPFSLDGTPGPRLRVGSIDNSAQTIALAVNQHGLGIVVWTDDQYTHTGNLRAAVVDLGAGTASAAVSVNAADDEVYLARIASASDGRFLVVWPNPPKAGSFETIRGRLLTACGNGVLEPGEACDDGNQLAGDCCSPTCSVEPLPGTCWRLAATSVLHFSATLHVRDQDASCSARCRTGGASTLVLLDDGTYRWPQGTARCTGGDVVLLPDEVGRWRDTRGRVRLDPRNVGALRNAFRTCTGVRLGSVRRNLRFGHDVLRGTQTVIFHRPGHPPVTVDARSRLNGLRLETGITPSPPRGAERVAECVDEIRLRCRLQ